jgi:Spy/CpxP family protein refolding chaperone
MRRVRNLGIIVAVLAVAAPLDAQQPRGRQQRARPPSAAQSRQAEQLLDRFSRRAAEALQLNDEAARGLTQTMQRFRGERETLRVRRQALRQELAQVVGRAPEDEGRVAELLDELLELEVRRAELDVREQQELSEFLSPIQRARLIYLRQRLAQQAMERQRMRGGPPPDGPPPDGPPERGVQEIPRF